MTMFKGLLAASITLAGITGATTADAAIVFTLAKGSFRDGAAVSGSFTTNDDRSKVLEFSLQTGAGAFRLDSNPSATPQPTAGFTFTSVNSSAQIIGTDVLFTVANPSQADGNQSERTLNLSYALADFVLYQGGDAMVVERDGQNERNSRIGGARVTFASATTGAVPEPATWAMMLIGFGGMGYAMRRNRRTTVRIRFA